LKVVIQVGLWEALNLSLFLFWLFSGKGGERLSIGGTVKQMKPWERVNNTIKGLAADRVPFGEVLIDPLFCQKAMRNKKFTFSLAQEFWEQTGLDLVVFNPCCAGDVLQGTPENIFRWREKTDYYLFAIISGGFSKGLETFGFTEFMDFAFKDPVSMQKMARALSLQEVEIGKKCVEAGVHAVMIGDDIAYQRGPYFSPQQMRELFFPVLQEQVAKLKALNIPVFFHSDGNLNAVLDDLLGMGFDGLQCLEPGAGMDIAAVKEKVKKEYGGQVCLMGNIDLSLLHQEAEDEKIREMVTRTINTAKKGGRYIFGTSGGLHQGLPAEKVRTMYQAARQASFY